MLDFNSYYAYHTNNLSYMEAEDEEDERIKNKEKFKDTLLDTNIQWNGNDIITYNASASLSHRLSLGSVHEKSSQGNPPTSTTTAAEDNNCSALRISSCKPLKFPLASEWLV
ncbi:hypothetical protein ACLKA7_013524 [Drosophila subpalustris]